MFRTKPSLASNVDDLVQLGMQVVVITENPEDEFNLVACLSHLKAPRDASVDAASNG